MKRNLLIAGTLVAIAQIIAIVAGQARFYALCLDVTLKRAYLFMFLPIFVAIFVQVLLYFKIPMLSLIDTDDVWAFSSFIGQVGTLYAVYKLMNNTCSNSIKEEA